MTPSTTKPPRTFMLLTWHGQGAVQLKTKDTTILIDPFNKQSGLTTLRKPFSAVLLTHGHKDRENIAAIKEPGIVIEGPGEYEVGDVIIEGSESNFEKPEESTQTLYTIRAEEITVAHLADLNHVLSDKQIDALGDVDVLFVPIGGHGLLDADKAAAIVSEIEPRMVVPIYYKIPGVKVTLDDEKKFCKAVGAKSEDATSLSLKKANLPAGEIKIVMLQKS